MEEEIRRLVARMWQDVASLPWQDPIWINSKEGMESARQHFVTATTFDILKAVTEGQEDGTKS